MFKDIIEHLREPHYGIYIVNPLKYTFIITEEREDWFWNQTRLNPKTLEFSREGFYEIKTYRNTKSILCQYLKNNNLKIVTTVKPKDKNLRGLCPNYRIFVSK